MSDPSLCEILLYQSPDNRTRIDVRLEGETVWPSQAQMAELFQTSKQNVGHHIRNVFEEKELEAASTVKQYLTVQTEGGAAGASGLDREVVDAAKARRKPKSRRRPC